MAFGKFSRFARAILAPAAALALGACTLIGYGFESGPAKEDNSAAVVEAADWDIAQTFTVDIRQNNFRPTIIRLFLGEPYIMVIENRDDVTHVFAAREFFENTAVRKLLTETEEIVGRRPIAIPLLPGEVKEIHFVPTRDGWYPFEDAAPGLFFSSFWLAPLSRGSTEGAIGAFIVEE